MIKSIAKCIRLVIFKIRFRDRNKHNHVIPQSVFPLSNVTIGKETYGPLNVLWFAPSSAKIKIGNYCSIGPEVKFMVGGNMIIDVLPLIRSRLRYINRKQKQRLIGT